MKYSIIIPTRDHCDQLLKPCLRSVMDHTHMDEVELIVSAHGCSDNTKWYLTRLKNQFVSLGFEDQFHVIEHVQSQGFAHACNQALRQARAEMVIILQPDCELLDQPKHAWIQRMQQVIDACDQTGLASLGLSHEPLLGQHYAPFDCVMMPRKVLQQVGVLDEQLPGGLAADVDWCVRLHNQGLHIQQVPELHTLVNHKQMFAFLHMPLETDWQQLYKQNMMQISQKPLLTEPAVPTLSVAQVGETYSWLRNTNAESAYLFDEVIKNNTYKVTPDMIAHMSVIDVGANQGMFSILAAAMGAHEVIACEPIRSTHDLLCKNVHKTPLKNITCVNKAVMGMCTGPLMISLHEESGHNSLYNMGQTHELVNCVSLQELVASCTQQDIFLKMDCEGAEYDIVLDSDAQVFDRIKYIGVEIHGDMHPDHKGVEKLQQAITNLGFTLLDRSQVGTWFWNAQGEVVRFEPMPQTVEIWGK